MAPAAWPCGPLGAAVLFPEALWSSPPPLVLNVAGMPLHLDVEPAALSLESSRLHGSLLSPDGVRAGAVVEFRLDGFDIYKNAVTEGAETRVRLRGPAPAASCAVCYVQPDSL